MSKQLATAIKEGKIITAVCPRCSGRVTLPTEVYKNTRYSTVRYEPTGLCHRCGVGWSWRTEENPTGSTAVYREDRGKVNVWWCDRVLEAPAPTIIEE